MRAFISAVRSRAETAAAGMAGSGGATVADQELDTRTTTGVVYWEGSQRVVATRAGERLGGEGYVELTGYARSMQDVL